MVNTIVTRSAVVFTALFLIVSVAVVNAESDIEIVVDGVSPNSGLSCSEGTIEIFENFEDTNAPSDSGLSCLDNNFDSLTNNDCYSLFALLPGFTMSSFRGNDFGRMGVLTPTTFGVTNVAVGSSKAKYDTNIFFDIPTNTASFHVFQTTTSDDPVIIEVYDKGGFLIGGMSQNLGTAAAPSFIQISSLNGVPNIARIRFNGQKKVGAGFYDLAFCAPNTIINKGNSPIVSGGFNLIQILGATPLGKVIMLFGYNKGSFIVGGSVCNGLKLGIQDPRILTTARANLRGVVNATPYVMGTGISPYLLEIVDISSCSILYPATQVTVITD